MGKDYTALTEVHREWITEQHLFFVATAPLAGDGHVNMSPKGYDTFRVLDDHTVAYSTSPVRVSRRSPTSGRFPG